MKITEEQLIKWAPNSAKVASIVADWFNKYNDDYAVNTPARTANFLSQAIHESASFTALREFASGSAYEGRKDLGNIYPGDGKKFKGRGYFDTTGRDNYYEIGKDLFPNAPDTFVKNPELLATPQYAMKSAFWFWNRHNLNHYADMPAEWTTIVHHNGIPVTISNVEWISYVINGGFNGLSDRVHFYNIIGNDFGLPRYIISDELKKKLGID